jgi:hypothetical protein
MSRAKQRERRDLIAQRMRERGTTPTATPAEIAAGVVYCLAPRSRRQAEVITAAWWPDWTPEVLAGLLEAGRTAAIAAHYQPPPGGRTGAGRAAWTLGIGRTSARDAMQRGQTTLAAWLAARADLSTAKSDEEL